MLGPAGGPRIASTSACVMSVLIFARGESPGTDTSCLSLSAFCECAHPNEKTVAMRTAGTLPKSLGKIRACMLPPHTKWGHLNSFENWCARTLGHGNGSVNACGPAHQILSLPT